MLSGWLYSPALAWMRFVLVLGWGGMMVKLSVQQKLIIAEGIGLSKFEFVKMLGKKLDVKKI